MNDPEMTIHEGPSQLTIYNGKDKPGKPLAVIDFDGIPFKDIDTSWLPDAYDPDEDLY